MSEQTSNPTSGQNVPKSKFRRKSQQEQTAASKLRMEKRGEKLDAANHEFDAKGVCKVCGYVYEGDALPEDYKCPLCGAGAEYFEEK